MNEEEILQKLNKYIELINKGYCDDCNELNVICGKSCNGSKNVKNAIESLIKIYKQQKEKNKELEETLKIATAMLTKGTYPEKNEGDNDFNKKFIAVDKIKEKIEDYEKMVEETFKDITWNGQNRRDNCYEIIKVLENLLEEK